MFRALKVSRTTGILLLSLLAFLLRLICSFQSFWTHSEWTGEVDTLSNYRPMDTLHSYQKTLHFYQWTLYSYQSLLILRSRVSKWLWFHLRLSVIKNRWQMVSHRVWLDQLMAERFKRSTDHCSTWRPFTHEKAEQLESGEYCQYWFVFIWIDLVVTESGSSA